MCASFNDLALSDEQHISRLPEYTSNLGTSIPAATVASAHIPSTKREPVRPRRERDAQHGGRVGAAFRTLPQSRRDALASIRRDGHTLPPHHPDLLLTGSKLSFTAPVFISGLRSELVRATCGGRVWNHGPANHRSHPYALAQAQPAPPSSISWPQDLAVPQAVRSALFPAASPRGHLPSQAASPQWEYDFGLAGLREFSAQQIGTAQLASVTGASNAQNATPALGIANHHTHPCQPTSRGSAAPISELLSDAYILPLSSSPIVCSNNPEPRLLDHTLASPPPGWLACARALGQTPFDAEQNEGPPVCLQATQSSAATLWSPACAENSGASESESPPLPCDHDSHDLDFRIEVEPEDRGSNDSTHLASRLSSPLTVASTSSDPTFIAPPWYSGMQLDIDHNLDRAVLERFVEDTRAITAAPRLRADLICCVPGCGAESSPGLLSRHVTEVHGKRIPCIAWEDSGPGKNDGCKALFSRRKDDLARHLETAHACRKRIAGMLREQVGEHPTTLVNAFFKEYPAIHDATYYMLKSGVLRG